MVQGAKIAGVAAAPYFLRLWCGHQTYNFMEKTLPFWHMRLNIRFSHSWSNCYF